MYKDKKTNISSLLKPVSHLPEVLGNPRERQEVLDQIYADPAACFQFQSFTKEQQNALVEFCMGNRSLKITYDPFFKHIFNHDKHPERLDRLLSAIMGQRVRVKSVLQREGDPLAAEASLVIMDILVELEDGTLTSVEMQKQGYAFPTERAYCYGADLLIRQYDRARNILKKQFNYKSLKPVYVIILMENSPALFRDYPTHYIHRSKTILDSGIEMENLINYIYIPLDIFLKIPHNRLTELEAWLYFLGSDNPVDIQRIIVKYPFFAELYRDIIYFRHNPKELIYMYSEALAIMDKNTIDFMIDEMRERVEIEIRKEMEEKVQSEIREELQEKIQSEIREELQSEVRKELQSEIREELQSEVRKELQSEIREELQSEVRKELQSEIAEKDLEIQRLKAALAAQKSIATLEKN